MTAVAAPIAAQRTLPASAQRAQHTAMSSLLAPVVQLDQDPACPNKTLYVSPVAPAGMARSQPWCAHY